MLQSLIAIGIAIWLALLLQVVVYLRRASSRLEPAAGQIG